MPVHSSLKASDSYDSRYYLAQFVVVSLHLDFDATQISTFPSPLNTHIFRTAQRPTPQPHPRFKICESESTQPDASYTHI